MALPTRQARHLELRHTSRAGAPGCQRRRPSRAGGVPGDQAGVPVFVQSRDGRTDLANRRETGSAIEGAWREAFAHAAIPDKTGAVRPAGEKRESSHRLHAGAEAARAGAREGERPVLAILQPARASWKRGWEEQVHVLPR